MVAVPEKIVEQKVTNNNNVVILPNVKLRKDGLPKRTRSNAKENRDNVYPYKEEDIPRIINYLVEQIKSSRNRHYELINRRNLALFVMGINIGLRVSDLISLKWSDIYDEKWEFLLGKKIKPQKQQRVDKNGKKKVKIVMLKYNDAFKKAVSDFREYCKPKRLDEYIFKSREGGYICRQTVNSILDEISKALGLTYNTACHSLRKTFARVRYDHSNDKEATLIELMTIFNHASPAITKKYICITEEEIEKLFNKINLGLDTLIEIGEIEREI